MPPKPPAKKAPAESATLGAAAAAATTSLNVASAAATAGAAAPDDNVQKVVVSTLSPGTTKSCMARGRAHHIAASFRDSRTWVVGGWEGIDESVGVLRRSDAPHVLSLAPLQDEWIAVDAVGDHHPGISQAAGVDVGDAILVYGGWDGTKRIGTTSIFSYEDARWAPFVTSDAGDSVNPPALTFHSATYVPKKVFVFGGNHQDGQSSDMYVLDITTTQWHMCPSLGAPQKRSSHAAAVLSEGFVAIFGGRGGQDGTTVLQDTALFDATSQHWVIGSKVEGPSPPARYGHAAIRAREKVVVVGGIGVDGECLSDAWMLSLIRPGVMSWTKLQLEGDQITGRCGHSLSWISTNQLLVYGGRKDSYNTIAVVQILDFSSVLPKEDDATSSHLSQSGSPAP